MSRTRMMYSAGIPLVGGGDPLPFMQASREIQAVFHVDPLNGSDGNPGDNIDQPFKTWVKAVGMVPSRGGAVIYGYPTADADEAVTISVPNVALVCAGRGNNRCTIKSTAGIPLTVAKGAYGFSACGVQFHGIAAGKEGVRQQANYYRYMDCDFLSDVSRAIRLFPDNTSDTDTASEGDLIDCWVRDSDSGINFENPAVGAVPGVGGTGPVSVRVIRPWFFNIVNQDIIDRYTAGGNQKTFTDCLVAGAMHGDRNKAVYITLTGGVNNDGFITGGRFAKDNARLSNVMVALPAAIVCADIYDATGLVDTSGF